MTAYDRAQEITAALGQRGVRATTDPVAVNPPCILVTPPGRTYDLPCGWTARWQLVAIAPAPSGTDRTTWAALDHMVERLMDLITLDTADLVSYTVGGTTYPAYLCAASEAI